MSQQSLGIESLQGGTNLCYKLSQIREAMCVAHSLLDHDDCGIKSSEKAEREGLLVPADVTFTICDGLREAEIEDMYNEDLYEDMLRHKYGVSTLSPKFKGDSKWSDRLARTFRHSGKLWNDHVEAKVKSEIAELIVASPGNALNGHKRRSFDALIAALEGKLTAIAATKL
jgi:hypothetical protein